MAYKRKNSPYYQVRRRNLPGYGDTGRISSGVKDRATAERMEHLLEDIARQGLLDPRWHAVLDAVKNRELTLIDLLAIKNRGGMTALLKALNDPLIRDAIAAYKDSRKHDRHVWIGLDQLEELTPEEARLSWLTAKRIMKICRKAEKEGQKRNSVHRRLLRAISLLLRFHLGNAERNAIFADVHFPREDDTREVLLTPEEIARLIKTARKLNYHEVALLIRVALQTSADRGVLLAGEHAGRKFRGLLIRDISIYQKDDDTYTGEVMLHDRKTGDRTRTVPIPDSLCRTLLAHCKNRDADEPVFSLRYPQLGYRWKRVRKKAGLKHVRFKDLRAQTAIYGEKAGVSLTVLQRVMGHGDWAMTRRYQAHAAAMSDQEASAIEEEMGLS